MTSDDIVSVTWVEISREDVDEEDCPPAWVTSVVVCGSEVMWYRDVEVIIPGAPGEMTEVTTPEVSSFLGLVTPGAVVSD